MTNSQITDNEATGRSQRTAQIPGYLENVQDPSPEKGNMPQQATLSLATGTYAGRGSTGLRAQAMQQMQRTYGNRAVQRQMAGSTSNRHIAVQRAPANEENDEARKARKVRTVISKGVGAARQGSNAIAQKEINATTAALDKTRGSNDLKKEFDAWGAKEKAVARAEKSVEGKVARGLEKHMGGKSAFGKGLNGANYGLQFWDNLTQGQNVGEAASGAGGGGFAGNQMSRQAFNPKAGGSGGLGWTDMIVNLVNAGLSIAGVGEGEDASTAGKIIRTTTQTAADATPSSFGTNLGSNVGRTLWNLGDGVINGDWSGMERQSDDLTHGRMGSPLQGYASFGEALGGGIADLQSGNTEHLDRIRKENASGERGTLAKVGSKIGSWARDDADPWLNKKFQEGGHFALDIMGLGPSGPSAEEQKENQAAFISTRDKELAEIEKNKDQIMKEQGPQAYYQMINVANLPPQVRSLVDAAPKDVAPRQEAVPKAPTNPADESLEFITNLHETMAAQHK